MLQAVAFENKNSRLNLSASDQRKLPDETRPPSPQSLKGPATKILSALEEKKGPARREGNASPSRASEEGFRFSNSPSPRERRGGWGVRILTLAVLLTLILGFGAPASFAIADDRQSHTYSIEAQDLGSALKAFAFQSQREIFFAPDLTQGKQSHGVNGNYEDLSALNRILLRHSIQSDPGQRPGCPSQTYRLFQSPILRENGRRPRVCVRSAIREFFFLSPIKPIFSNFQRSWRTQRRP